MYGRCSFTFLRPLSQQRMDHKSQFITGIAVYFASHSNTRFHCLVTEEDVRITWLQQLKDFSMW